jgi:serine/threonine-protein kinase
MRIALLLVALCILCALVDCSAKVDEFTMPDLVGKYWTRVEPQLRTLGWTGMLVRGDDVFGGPANVNRIMSQDPPAGTRQAKDVTITVRFGR